jgi:hypothetical protein
MGCLDFKYVAETGNYSQNNSGFPMGKPVDTRIVSLVLGARPSAIPFKLAARPEMPQETGSQPLLRGMTRLANNKRIHVSLSRVYFGFFVVI